MKKYTVPFLRTARRGCLLLCLFAYCLGTTTTVLGNTYPVSLEERSDHSSYIVLGHLKGQQSYWDEAKQNIYTLNLIEVTAYLKGNNSATEIGIITPGGVVDNQAMLVFPSPELASYNEYIFFIQGNNTVIDNKQFHTTLPELIQAELYADVQGAMTKQLGFFHDLHSEPKQTEAELCSKITARTGVKMTTPRGARAEQF